MASSSIESLPGAGHPAIQVRDLTPFMEQQPQKEEEVQTLKYGRVTGRVTSIKDKNHFTVVAPNTGKKFCMFWEQFNPVRVGDLINCVIGYVDLENPHVRIMKPPLVQTPCDKESIVQIFITMFRKQGFGYKHGIDLYDYLDEYVKQRQGNATGIDNVCKCLTYFAERTSTDPRMSIRIFEFLSRKLNTYKLMSIPGKIGEHVFAKHMLAWWRNTNDMRQLYLLSLTRSEILDTKMPLSKLYTQLLKNPYVVPRISMEKCFDIDSRTGRKLGENDIYCGTIVRDIWKNLTQRGWTCTSKYWIVRRYPDFSKVKELLLAEYNLFYDIVNTYANPDDEVPEGKAKLVYFVDVYNAVVHVTEFLKKAIMVEPYIALGDPHFENENLDDDQRSGIAMAMKQNISILTGPAGSGKTTTVKDLIHNLKLNQVPFMCCSFTGKAVSRIKKVTGDKTAATMHRMIAKSDDYGSWFKYLIIDESSMVDLKLFHDFLLTFDHKFQIVFVGDPNQLPPISWGSFFNAMLQTHSVPKTALTSIHRVLTAEGTIDGIISNTTRISKWRHTVAFPFENTDNFITETCEVTRIRDIVMKYKAEGLKPQDFVIISPYNRLLSELNLICQLIYNHNKPYTICPDGRRFHVDDKVMMLVNNYDIDVMNGEEGIVTECGPEHIFVQFDEKNTKIRVAPTTDNSTIMRNNYNDGEMTINGMPENASDEERRDTTTDEIKHSFALSVHKSQGDEWKRVIFFLSRDANTKAGFLNRNLIYTALTRAKCHMHIVGSIMNVSMSIANMLPYRCDCTADRLRTILPRIYKEIIEDPLDDCYGDPDGDDYPSGDEDCDFF